MADFSCKNLRVTWFKTRLQSNELQVFCRTDYHLATPGLAALARQAHIYREQKFSDHAPLMIDYDFQL